MIVTSKGRIPFLWILFAALAWAAGIFQSCIVGGTFIFSLKKFVDNPAGLTFIMSLPGIVSLILRPIVNFMSDRIWTRFGRRKPFVTSGWMGVVLSIGLMPVMPNFWMLLACYIAYNFFVDISDGPMETLKQEVVPPRQRGTSTAIGTWIFNFASVTFNLVAIGRFDDYKFMAGVPFTGEQAIYWSTCAAMVMILLLIMLGIRELNQHSPLRGQRLNLGNFFRSILNRNLWPVYLLITGYGILNSGLGPLGALLYTDQWQFTKQEMGYNFVIGGVLNIFIIALVGLFADKLPRMKAYQLLMVLFLAINFSFYLYVHHVLYDRTPTLVELVLFGETLSVIAILMGMIYMPLVYDYVPRNELGTYAAGAAVTNKITGILTINGVGLFIWAYSVLFLPPGGEMCRVAFAESKSNSEITALVATSGLAANYPGQRLTAEAWYATHAALDYGRGFELRVKNDESLQLKAKRDRLDQERSLLTAKERNAQGFAETQAKKGNATAEQQYLADVNELNAKIVPLAAEIEKLDAELARRAAKFRDDVTLAFGPQLLRDGDQVRAAFVEQILIFEYALSRRPAGNGIEKMLNVLRETRPDIVDLRLVRQADGWVLSVSVEAGKTADADLGREVGELLARTGAKRLGGDLVLPALPVTTRLTEAVGLDLLVLEDPLDNHPSPVTRTVNGIIDHFDDIPRPQRRVWATARALRVPGICDHTSVRVASGDDNAIRVLAVYQTQHGTETNGPAEVSTAVTQRIEKILGDLPADKVEQALDLYRRVVTAAAQNRITVARPLLTAGFATMKYDYMCGYIWMLILGFLALAITIMFVRREAKGLVRKRGREEADAEKAAEDKAELEEKQGHPEAVQHYTPGFFWPKAGMLALGLVLVTASLVTVGPDLRLLLFGERAQAVATRIIKQRIGGAEQVLTTDAQVRAVEEYRDRSYVFWNEYEFQLPDGKAVQFRAPSGSQLKPAYYLLDSDGLPTTVTVCYARAHPDQVMLPGEYSTWFAPGALGVIGLLGVFVGGVLLYNARKGIALPILTGAQPPGDNPEKPVA